MAGSYEVLEKFCEAGGIDRAAINHHHPIGVSAELHAAGHFTGRVEGRVGIRHCAS